MAPRDAVVHYDPNTGRLNVTLPVGTESPVPERCPLTVVIVRFQSRFSESHAETVVRVPRGESQDD